MIRRCLECDRPLGEAHPNERFCPTRCYRKYWLARNTPTWDYRPHREKTGPTDPKGKPKRKRKAAGEPAPEWPEIDGEALTDPAW